MYDDRRSRNQESGCRRMQEAGSGRVGSRVRPDPLPPADPCCILIPDSCCILIPESCFLDLLLSGNEHHLFGVITGRVLS